jgi:hypothetical protein
MRCCEYGNEPLVFHKWCGTSWLAEKLLVLKEWERNQDETPKNIQFQINCV